MKKQLKGSKALDGFLLFTRHIRRNVTRDFPMNQVAILVSIYGHGDAGATYADISGGLVGGMSLSSISKNIGKLTFGHRLTRIEPDEENRKRSRVFLTERGTELVRVLEACLTGAISTPEDLPTAEDEEDAE